MTAGASAILSGLEAHLGVFEARLGDLLSASSAVELLAAPVVRGGGKRLRPALVMLACQAAGGDVDERVQQVAVGLELIHTATLIHDDVIDDSATRRGVTSVHIAAGLPAAIIGGDHLLVSGLGEVARGGGGAMAAEVADTVTSICEGELDELSRLGLIDIGEEIYEAYIGDKTAGLIEACCRCGAQLATDDENVVTALGKFGWALGMAFQIADDVLDYTADAVALGKPVGADLRQGTITLPILLALRDPEVAVKLRELLTKVELNDDDIAVAVSLVRSSSAIAAAANRAQEFADRAIAELADLPGGAACKSLLDLARFAVARSH